MKKITLFTFVCLLFTVSIFSQTITSAQTFFPTTSGGLFAAQIEITPTEVRLGIVAQEDRWFALGFGAMNMNSGNDVVIYDGNNVLLTDRSFVGQGNEPVMDANQDWTILYNLTNADDPQIPAGHRGIGAIRSLTGSDANDYTFSNSDLSIDIPVVWAHGNGALGAGSYNVAYHGPFRGAANITGFTLSVEDFDLSKFKISPNPVTSEFNIELPDEIDTANVEVYDVLGKKIYTNQISNFNSTINSSSWHNGIYLVRVISEDVSQTKRIIKQ